MARVSGACIGLFTFAVVVLAGMAAGNSTATILSRALWAMAAFFLLGSLLGYVGMQVVDEYAIRRRQELFGDVETESRGAGATADGDGTVSSDRSVKERGTP